MIILPKSIRASTLMWSDGTYAGGIEHVIPQISTRFDLTRLKVGEDMWSTCKIPHGVLAFNLGILIYIIKWFNI